MFFGELINTNQCWNSCCGVDEFEKINTFYGFENPCSFWCFLGLNTNFDEEYVKKKSWLIWPICCWILNLSVFDLILRKIY